MALSAAFVRMRGVAEQPTEPARNGPCLEVRLPTGLQLRIPSGFDRQPEWVDPRNQVIGVVVNHRRPARELVVRRNLRLAASNPCVVRNRSGLIVAYSLLSTSKVVVE